MRFATNIYGTGLYTVEHLISLENAYSTHIGKYPREFMKVYLKFTALDVFQIRTVHYYSGKFANGNTHVRSYTM